VRGRGILMASKKLSGLLDLELAWRRIKKDQYNDMVPDVIELRDIERDKKNTIDRIKKNLDSGYEPSPLIKIDVPKKGYTLRPASYMNPEDRIVYQAVIDYISKRCEEPPEDCVFSYRLDKNKRSSNMCKFWKPLWLKMRKLQREIYDEGFSCLLRTDITAYFEHIDYSILRTNILNGQVKNKQILDLLQKLLRKWAVSDVKYIGIPQGYDASSFIGNIYLINLDKLMKRGGFKYSRYSDEIYIFTKDMREARKAIKSITHELRKLHLNLQDAKTDIITDPYKVIEEIGTEEEDKTKDFDYEFQRQQENGKFEKSEADIIKKYKEVTRNGRAKKVDISKLIWCINRLTKIKSDKAVNFTLRRFADFPFLSDTFYRYLQQFANRKNVKSKIVEFLNSEDNFYEWQEMWLLFILSNSKKLDFKQLSALRSIIRSKDKHWASKAVAILALGKLGDDTDRIWLRDLYLSEHNDYVKRAISVSIHNLHKSARNKFYTEIENESDSCKRLVIYLRQELVETI